MLVSLMLIAALEAQPVPPADTGPLNTGGRRADVRVLPVPLIADAPADDFGRVAWCHGALSGHMDIAERVQSVLPLSETIQTIGSAYLRGYEAALSTAPDGKTETGRVRAESQRSAGFAAWDRVRLAKPEPASGAYINWSLPGDCEHAAKRLAGREDIFQALLTPDEAALFADTLKPAKARTPQVIAEAPVAEAAAPSAEAAEETPSETATSAKSEQPKKPGWASGLMDRLTGWGKKKD